MLSRRLRLKPEISEIGRLNAWLDHAIGDAALGERLAADLRLCLNETVGNVILYAFGPHPDPRIEVRIALREGAAAAAVIDNGRPFNPLTWPRRPKPSDLASADGGGYGIQLVRDTAQAIAYDRSGGRNRLHISCGGRTSP